MHPRLQQVLSRAQVVEQSLPHRMKRPGSRWQMRDTSVEPFVDHLLNVIADGADEPCGVTWFKRAERKQVFRFNRSLIGKVFLLPELSLRLKYRRYARDEAAYMIVAAEKGILVPSVHAIGHFRNRLGMVWQAAMITSELTGMRTVVDLLRGAAGYQDRVRSILDAALPMFEQLYRTGCKHIDVNSGNVLLDPEDLTKPPALIDFKYAGFHLRPSLEVTMFQAAQFIRFSGDLVAPSAADRWLESLLDRLGVDDPRRRAWCRSRYEHHRTHTYSRQQRQRLNPYPDWF